MSPMLKPKADATDEYHVMHGESQIGQIYKRKAAVRPEAQWLWALNDVPGVHAGVVLTGLAGTPRPGNGCAKGRLVKVAGIG
jgi:hypothetical protein